MKVYYEYEKETQEWTWGEDLFLQTYQVVLRKGSSNRSFEEMEEEWVNNRVSALKNNSNYRNVAVDTKNRVISYESLSTEYEDDVEIFEVETVKNLVSLMKKKDCTYFFEDSEHKNRWKIE